MVADSSTKQSKLVAVLREGVAVVQMVFFKELKTHIEKNYPQVDEARRSMLTGAITNELFGTPNPDPKFKQFCQENKAVIEQEMLGLAANLPELRRYITDALRVQVLCDNHEGKDSAEILTYADKLGILLRERDIPLPSTFMTLVRGLGELHQLIIAPVWISPEEDQSLVH
jgi:hypothetical protein